MILHGDPDGIGRRGDRGGTGNRGGGDGGADGGDLVADQAGVAASAEEPEGPEVPAAQGKAAATEVSPARRLMPYDWWISAYDAVTHAFPIMRAPDARFYEALCQHTVPPELLVRRRGIDLCPHCLVLAGNTLPDLRYSG